MSSNYPIEALLRPPVEWWSTFACTVTGAAALLAPGCLLLSPDAGVGLGAVLLPLAALRFKQGYKVYSYQHRLTKLPLISTASKDIPQSKGELYLGKGFYWDVKHTQRLYDCRQPDVQQFIKRKLENTAIGGNPMIHGVEPKEHNIFMNLSDRVGHTLVLGTTRVGKTRLLEILAAQDIQRGDTVIVFDPKGDAELLRRIVFEANRAGREDDLIIYHLGFPDASSRYNPIGSFARVTEVANRLANQLPNSGESTAFKEFSWRFINIVAQALVILGERPTYRNIRRYILDFHSLLERYANLKLTEFDPHWQDKVNAILRKRPNNKNVKANTKKMQRVDAVCEYIDDNNYQDEVLSALRSACEYDKTYYDKITASLLPLLEKLTTGQSAHLISPEYLNLEDDRPIFDWMQVIRGKKIVYVGLDALSDSTVASAVGNSMFSDLCSVAGQLYKYGVGEDISSAKATKTFHPVCVHADEFNELIGDDFIPLLNKAGGAGVQVTAYTQTWSDVEAQLQNTAKAGQVSGNLNTIICLRVLDEDTATMVTNKLPQRVTIKTLLQVSGVSDGPQVGSHQDFTSSNEDRINTLEVPMLSPDDLIQLPKGQAFVLLNGGRLVKVRLDLPHDDMSNIPEAIEHMAQQIEERAKALDDLKGEHHE